MILFSHNIIFYADVAVFTIIWLISRSVNRIVTEHTKTP